MNMVVMSSGATARKTNLRMPFETQSLCQVWLQKDTFHSGILQNNPKHCAQTFVIQLPATILFRVTKIEGARYASARNGLTQPRRFIATIAQVKRCPG